MPPVLLLHDYSLFSPPIPLVDHHRRSTAQTSAIPHLTATQRPATPPVHLRFGQTTALAGRYNGAKGEVSPLKKRQPGAKRRTSLAQASRRAKLAPQTSPAASFLKKFRRNHPQRPSEAETLLLSAEELGPFSSSPLHTVRFGRRRPAGVQPREDCTPSNGGARGVSPHWDFRQHLEHVTKGSSPTRFVPATLGSGRGHPSTPTHPPAPGASSSEAVAGAPTSNWGLQRVHRSIAGRNYTGVGTVKRTHSDQHI